MAIAAPLNSLIIPPPTTEPEWVTRLIASKPQAAEALAEFVGFWRHVETETDPALAARSDADALAELRAFTADSPAEDTGATLLTDDGDFDHLNGHFLTAERIDI